MPKSKPLNLDFSKGEKAERDFLDAQAVWARKEKEKVAKKQEARRQEFLKLCDDPQIRVAARKVVLAMEVLHKHNIRVYDWCVSPNRGGTIDAELEDDLGFEKKWITVGRVK